MDVYTSAQSHIEEFKTTMAKRLGSAIYPKVASHGAILRLLVFVPITLALFALVLRMEEARGKLGSVANEGLVHEGDFIRSVDRMPRLESRQAMKEVSHAPVKYGFNGVEWDAGEGMSEEDLRVAFVVTTSEDPERIIIWMMYHRAIGVRDFYLFTEGSANTPEARRILEKEPGVKIVPRNKELDDIQAKSRAWNETWLSAFFNKPCNHALFVKQSLNMESAFVAFRMSIRFVFAVDAYHFQKHPTSCSILEHLQKDY